MNFLIHNIIQIIDGYESPQPLNLFLKPFFAANKKLGSRDRRSISEGVYLYFRMYRFYKYDNPLALIKQGIELGLTNNRYLVQSFESIPYTPLEKQDLSHFPALSPAVDRDAFFESLQHQPRMFIRLMRNHAANKEILAKKFEDIAYIQLPGTEEWAISLPNGAKLQELLPETDYVVQDYTSQSILPLAKAYFDPSLKVEQIWDVCSGAGGKTIMAKTLWRHASVMATDIRGNVLKNLQLRTKNYGYKKVATVVADLSEHLPLIMKDESYDLIIYDAPCSGSGTWARTPEQFAFFKIEDLSTYTDLQFKIAQNAIQKLEANAAFVYITCSVFKEENEDMVQRIQENNAVQLVHQSMIDGIDTASDAMFYAVFTHKA